MLEGIKAFFGGSMSADSEDEHVKKRDIRLAACALLLELAYADDEFSEDEFQHLEGAVRRQYGLDKAQADRLIRLAERARAEAVDLWQFTSLIREHYSTGQKMVLAEIMWGLVYSDGELSVNEAYLMRKVCNLLDLEPGYLDAAERRVKSAGEVDEVDDNPAGDDGID